MPEFTPVQQKILDVLSDGMPHHPDQLVACLDDELSTKANLAHQVRAIRYKLRAKGQDLICEFIHRQGHYRHVRLLHSANDGYR